MATRLYRHLQQHPTRMMASISAATKPPVTSGRIPVIYSNAESRRLLMTSHSPQIGPLAPQTLVLPPPHCRLDGRYTSLVPLKPEHSASLFKHLGGVKNDHLWRYMFSGGYAEEGQFQKAIADWSQSSDPLYFSVMSGPRSDPLAQPAGLISLMSIVPSHRRIEIGCITFGSLLQRSTAATEACFLLMQHAFEDLGNSRVEWKADELNKPSLAAAERLGFFFEGVFRKHMVIKGRYRDTAWYSTTEDEWPRLKQGFDDWLAVDNFDSKGQQRRSLGQCRST